MGKFTVILPYPNNPCEVEGNSMREDKNTIVFEDDQRCTGIFFIEKVIGVIFHDSNT